MLSRVAANLYWFGRYLQRAESTARLVGVHGLLLMDLPRRKAIGWSSLIDILGVAEPFAKAERVADEAGVVSFLLHDRQNPGSVLSSLNEAREVLRTLRDTVPREIWERLNDLYYFVESSGDKAAQRRHRQDFLDQVVDGALLISGMLVASMSRDVGFQFLRIGTNLEQADMTTRIIDVRSTSVIHTRSVEDLAPFQNIQWLSVLRSLSGYQMYRRHVRARVTGAHVLRFLLQDREFPRSVAFCLIRIQRTLPKLPPQRAVERALSRPLALVNDADVQKLTETGLGDFMDEIQKGLADFHDSLSAAYFKAA